MYQRLKACTKWWDLLHVERVVELRQLDEQRTALSRAYEFQTTLEMLRRVTVGVCMYVLRSE